MTRSGMDMRVRVRRVGRYKWLLFCGLECRVAWGGYQRAERKASRWASLLNEEFLVTASGRLSEVHS